MKSHIQQLAEAKRILVRARSILSKPERWTKEVFTRDRYNPITDEREYAYCSLGAISAAQGNYLSGRRGTLYQDPKDALPDVDRDDPFVAELTKRYLRSHIPVRDIPLWNDRQSTTHAMVLTAFDKAIESAGQDLSFAAKQEKS